MNRSKITGRRVASQGAPGEAYHRLPPNVRNAIPTRVFCIFRDAGIACGHAGDEAVGVNADPGVEHRVEGRDQSEKRHLADPAAGWLDFVSSVKAILNELEISHAFWGLRQIHRLVALDPNKAAAGR